MVLSTFLVNLVSQGRVIQHERNIRILKADANFYKITNCYCLCSLYLFPLVKLYTRMQHGWKFNFNRFNKSYCTRKIGGLFTWNSINECQVLKSAIFCSEGTMFWLDFFLFIACFTNTNVKKNDKKMQMADHLASNQFVSVIWGRFDLNGKSNLIVFIC